MKTSIKTVFASALTAIILTSSAFTTFAKEKAPVNTTATPSGFNKIAVNGNANVVLIQASTENIQSEDVLNQHKTTITQKGQTLYINSQEEKPATIYVYVKDLQRISASNEATVSTSGKFNLPVLQIFLDNRATVYVDATIGSLYTDTKDKANLSLSGSYKEHNVMKTDVAKINTNDFYLASK